MSPYACFCLSSALMQQSHLACTSERHHSSGICLDLPLPPQIIVKEKGVFTNVISPSTKAKLRILFEVAPLSLLVSPSTHLSHERPLSSVAEASPPLVIMESAIKQHRVPSLSQIARFCGTGWLQIFSTGCFMEPGTSPQTVICMQALLAGTATAALAAA